MLNPLLYRPPTAEEIELKSYRPPPAADGGPHFIFDGNVLTLREFWKFLLHVNDPVIVAAPTIIEPNLIQLFDSHEAFEDWGAHTYLADAFEAINRIIHNHRYPDEVYRSSLGVGLVANTPFGAKLPAVVEPVPGAPERRSSATLFEKTDFTGSRQLRFGASAITDLAEFNFSGATSSVQTDGVLMLSDKVNFGGYRFYIVGESHIDVPNLARWGFDKSARSAILI